MNRQERLEWSDFVFASHELRPAHKLVLLALSKFSDWPTGTNARPGVALLADRCALSHRAVDAALNVGRCLGLIEQTARANPKRHLAATYRLLPAPVSIRTSVRTQRESEPTSTRTSVRTETGFQPAQNEFQSAQTGVSIRTTVRATKSVTPNQNTKEGDARATNADQDAAADQLEADPPAGTLEPVKPSGEQQHSKTPDLSDIPPPPPRYCSAHMPNGAGVNCGRCADTRHNFTQWEKRYGHAWDALQPRIGKAAAKAMSLLPPGSTLADLFPGLNETTDSSPIHVESERVVDAELVDESQPACRVDGCTKAATTDDGLCGRHHATSQRYGKSP
jgi:hypothetical protein